MAVDPNRGYDRELVEELIAVTRVVRSEIATPATAVELVRAYAQIRSSQIKAQSQDGNAKMLATAIHALARKS